jgi:hypothetical protein
MISHLIKLFRMKHNFELHQVVILKEEHQFKYLGYFPVRFDLIPKYWKVVELMDSGRIELRLTPVFDLQQKDLVKNTYFPGTIEVEAKHVELAPELIQILYGGKNGHV